MNDARRLDFHVGGLAHLQVHQEVAQAAGRAMVAVVIR